MLNFEMVGNKSLVASLNITGVPTVTHPLIGDGMSNGIEITESNQKEYTSPFIREDDECSLLNLDVDLAELNANKDDTARLIITKDFTDTSDDDIESFMYGLSNLTIKDEITGETYSAKVVEVVGYDIQDI